MNPFRSKLGTFNFLILQWFCVRLQETVNLVDGHEVHEKWNVIGFIVPLTGWWGRYRYIWRLP